MNDILVKFTPQYGELRSPEKNLSSSLRIDTFPMQSRWNHILLPHE